jgi:hypothetical protein
MLVDVGFSVVPTPRKVPESVFTFKLPNSGGAHLLNGVIAQRPMFKGNQKFDFAFGPIYRFNIIQIKSAMSFADMNASKLDVT